MSIENSTGRVAVITGASSGIGEATARAPAADGHRVALLARRVEVFLDHLVADGGGDLINRSSVTGRSARSGNEVYAATKWGINGWSESLHQQLQPGVRVIVIEPNAVATELSDHITHAETKAAAEQTYQAMSITSRDIAEIVAFAVSRPRSVSPNEILVRPTGQAG